MSTSLSHPPQVLGLRPGERVRIRSAAEIFSSLDERGTLDNLPFMPEMVAYCGRILPVFKRADRTCGDRSCGFRRMENTVHLGNLRCDGAAHGGCQAACLMYWKEAWLERVEPGCKPRLRELSDAEKDFVSSRLLPATTNGNVSNGSERAWRCQATEIPRASTPLHGWKDFDQYARDVRAWGLLKVVRGLLIEAFNRFQYLNRRFLPQFLLLRRGLGYPFIEGKLDKGQTPSATLGLKPGDLVRIKSKEEILATLDRTCVNRGLSFDPEMVQYCGRPARVRGRVERLIDEENGKMIQIRRDCIILEGVTCTADFHRFCTRAIYPYWREVWLEKVG